MTTDGQKLEYAMDLGARPFPRSLPVMTLAFIALILFLNYLDRYSLSILIENIKHDLAISDLQIGLLTGAAFALFYSTLTIPIARLSDRYSRVHVLAIALALWSAATALCGAATGFGTLLVARLLVGSGEAGAIPAAHPMIADLYPARGRAGAMAILGVAAAAGGAAAPLVGGYLDVRFGWRLTFVIVATPGIFLAGLLWLLLRDPREYLLSRTPSAGATSQSYRKAIGRLYQRKAFRYLIVALALLTLSDYGLAVWIAPMFGRKLHMPPDQLGELLFVYQGIPQVVGTVAGGFLTNFLCKLDRRWMVWVPTIATAITAPLLLAFAMAHDGTLAMRLLVLPSITSGFYIGPCYALIQGLAGQRSRAIAASLVVFAVNLVGAGLGPVMIGAISGHLERTYGNEALQHAFFVLPALYALAVLGFLIVSRHLEAGFEDATVEDRCEDGRHV